MRIWTVALVLLLLASSQLFSRPVDAAALHYGPAVVELTGTLVLEEYFGPPGFGEDPKTDSRELYAILVLDAPVSVEGVPADLIDKTYPDVRWVQLVRGIADPPFSPYQSMHVIVSGTLYGRHTGHHHTDVLLIVQSIAVR